MNPRYERYGWDYEAHRPAPEREIAWYRRHARETGGPVLELACGTGTLLGPMADTDVRVVGLDVSDRMLGLARDRVNRLPASVRDRIRLVRGDMSRLELGERFGLVVIADNSFREVETLPRMRAVLDGARRHLRPDGRLLLAERRFEPALYVDGVRNLPWSDPIEEPGTGATVRRRIRIRHDAGASRIRGIMTYRTERPDGTRTEEEVAFENPVLTTDEYRALLSDAGFSVRVRVGYEDRADDGVDPMLCFIACPERPPAPA